MVELVLNAGPGRAPSLASAHLAHGEDNKDDGGGVPNPSETFGVGLGEMLKQSAPDDSGAEQALKPLGRARFKAFLSRLQGAWLEPGDCDDALTWDAKTLDDFCKRVGIPIGGGVGLRSRSGAWSLSRSTRSARSTGSRGRGGRCSSSTSRARSSRTRSPGTACTSPRSESSRRSSCVGTSSSSSRCSARATSTARPRTTRGRSR